MLEFSKKKLRIFLYFLKCFVSNSIVWMKSRIHLTDFGLWWRSITVYNHYQSIRVTSVNFVSLQINFLLSFIAFRSIRVSSANIGSIPNRSGIRLVPFSFFGSSWYNFLWLRLTFGYLRDSSGDFRSTIFSTSFNICTLYFNDQY